MSLRVHASGIAIVESTDAPASGALNVWMSGPSTRTPLTVSVPLTTSSW